MQVTQNDYEFVVDPSDNEAEYRCEAVNAAAVAPLSASVRLKVYCMFNTLMFEWTNYLTDKFSDPPARVFVEGNLLAKVGDSVALLCRSAASHPPARLSWLVDGKPLANVQVGISPAPNGKGIEIFRPFQRQNFRFCCCP